MSGKPSALSTLDKPPANIHRPHLHELAKLRPDTFYLIDEDDTIDRPRALSDPGQGSAEKID